MKAALALVFFACIAGSMASSIQSQFLGQLLQQGNGIATTVINQLQGQIGSMIQQALGQLSGLLGSMGGRFDFNSIFDSLKPMLGQFTQGLLNQVLGGLGGLIGGRAGLDLGSYFNEFLAHITGQVTQIGQHLLNQGLASVLGGLGSLGGSRGISDIFAGLSQQISGAVAIAQGVLSGALGNLSTLGSSLLDASKPHWEQLQEQLVGHGLNVLGSISESVGNLHGSITSGGR